MHIGIEEQNPATVPIRNDKVPAIRPLGLESGDLHEIPEDFFRLVHFETCKPGTDSRPDQWGPADNARIVITIMTSMRESPLAFGMRTSPICCG